MLSLFTKNIVYVQPKVPVLQFLHLSNRDNVVYFTGLQPKQGFLKWLSGKESAYNAGDTGSIPMSGRSLEKEAATDSSSLPGKSNGQRSLVDYSPWGC